MEVNVYTIFDSKARAFLQPWFAANHAVAFRNVERSCRSPNSPFLEFPEDFTLFCIGVFDDIAGVISCEGPGEALGNFIQFLPPRDGPANTGSALQ